jgi:predicted alpha/beta superfamily hydrolase
MRKIFTLLSVLGVFALYAQHPRVDIPGSEVRKITSSIVKGQEYELQILLPGGYKNSQKKYPVVYLMDSQWDFPLVKSLYGEQYYDGFIPELIIVGVTWGGVNPNPDSLRARDYTPTRETRLPQSGGADKFLSFMRDELFPFIETNYKADNKNRVLMGCSLGGLITLYALFTHTDMFTGYVAASPAYSWGRDILYNYEKTFYQTNRTASARLYMTMGEVEHGLPGYQKFVKYLQDRHYPALRIGSRVLENTGHSGTKSEGFARGLQYAYERPKMKIDPIALKRYIGNYVANNGEKMQISLVGKNLVATFGGNNNYTLLAASEQDFYSLAEFMNLHFVVSDNTVEELQLERYNNSSSLKKVN